ncbi:MAG: MurR/RpiR family transcriptional regulator [Acidimicrobiia bacterium]|nr:MurR/RpiR family transcriptional regulator [Acidimicrobiia bacterium]
MQQTAADSTTPTLGERIASAGPSLTPTERRLARLVLDDPTTIAFGTVADLAREADTSGPSVVRFATKLDFDGYGDLQDHVRASLTEQLRRPTDRLRLEADPGSSENHARSTDPAADLVDQVSRALNSLDHDTLLDVATSIARAPGTVWVVCAETSATPGTLLTGNLRLLRPGVRRLDGAPPAMASQVTEARPGDVAIVIDFPRYESAIVAAATELAAADVTLIAITDGPLSPLASLAESWLGVDVDAVGPFDSVLPVVAVVELLIAEIARLLRNQATDRLDRIERLWTDGRVFDQTTNSRTAS